MGMNNKEIARNFSSPSAIAAHGAQGWGPTIQTTVVERAFPRAEWITCIALMTIAMFFRIYVLTTVLAHIDSDQAVLGIMAYHIQMGDRPVFYYGQPYMGSLEAYMAAGIFHVWGANEFLVRVPALAFSVVFVGAVYWLGVTLYGRWIGLLSGLFLALGPSILINWSTAAGAGYIEPMVFGTLLFLLAIRYPDLRMMPLPAAVASGLLAGLGLWIEPMIGDYLVPLALFFTIRLLIGVRERHLSTWSGLARSLVAIIAGTIVGCAPLLVYNLQNHGETFSFLGGRATGGNHLAVAERLVTESMPIMLGLITPTSVAVTFNNLVAQHPIEYLVGVVAGASILGRLIFDPRCLLLRMVALAHLPRDTQAATPLPAADRPMPQRGDHARSRMMGHDGLLALFGVCCVLLFLLTRFGATPWATHLPRYLIPLYTITPLVLDCLIPRVPRRLDIVVAALATGILVTVGAATTLSAGPRIGIVGLTDLLETRQIDVAYANYWLADRLSFLSHEHVLGIAVADNLDLGQVRTPTYLDIAANTPARNLAWVFDSGSSAEKQFRLYLQRHNVHPRRAVIDREVVYYAFTTPLRAPLNAILK